MAYFKRAEFWHRTGKEHRFDEAVGNQVEVTWLSFPDHTIDCSKHYPKLNTTLCSVQLEEALDIAALNSIGEIRKRSGPQPFYTIQDFVTESGFPRETIEGWLRRLRRKKHMVLQAPPGTGKTYIAERLAKVMVSETAGFWKVVQFHPSYAYEDFIQGIRPRVSDGQISYDMESGRFVEFCDAAAKNTAWPYVLIIDEINRANLSRVFGELMYLLEYRDKEIRLASGERYFQISENVYLIGTMNTADRSIALVDHALRWRFSFVHIGPEYVVLEKFLSDRDLPTSLVTVLRKVNAAINDRNYEVGISYFLTDDDKLRETLQDLLERGLRVDESILCVVDGGKGIRKALVDVLGDLAVIQRCQIHKLRNLRSYLPKSRHAYVLQTMKEAYKCKSADKARKRLQALVSWLERNGYDEAAGSLREGMEETLTVVKLALPALLRQSLATTNAIENLNGTIRRVSRNVKRWKSPSMVRRWTALGVVTAQKEFRRIKGYRHMGALVHALRSKQKSLDSDEFAA